MNSFVIFNKINLYHNYIIFNNDPRNKNIGKKLIQNSPILENIKEINEKEYHALLIKNKVPYSPYDLQQQKSLLLENNFDNLNAISWDKGCYIGQEITARMKYRALLKKKLYALKIVSGSISTGEKIYNNGNTLGEVISRSNQYLFCMLRIEFVEEKSLNKKLLKINSTVTLQFL